MNLDPTWVPMNWPCGPLESARRSRSKNVSAELKQTLDAWARPAALELLKGTPVNCLLLEWADGVPEDSTQPQALKPLLEAAAGRGSSSWQISQTGQRWRRPLRRRAPPDFLRLCLRNLPPSLLISR